MVLSRKKNELTKENILKHVSGFDIAMAFWPPHKEFAFNKFISSPFRSDDTPSFVIGDKFGYVTFKDMGALDYRGDIWKFVQLIEGLKDWDQVLKAIDKRFQLGYSDGQVIANKPQLVTWEQPVSIHKPPPLIQVTERKFNKDELKWWSDRFQDISDLKREHIYAPAEIWRNRQKIPITQLTFCYFYPELNKWKLYRPNATKRTKKTPPWEWKWDNSMTDLTYIENLQSLKNCEVGIVNKAKKCRMVLRKATGIESICSIQAEDPSAMTEEDMLFIDQNCKRKISVMDNDKKGKEMSWWLTKKRGYEHCNVPDQFLDEYGDTDFTEMAMRFGLDSVTKHFKQKMII